MFRPFSQPSDNGRCAIPTNIEICEISLFTMKTLLPQATGLRGKKHLHLAPCLALLITAGCASPKPKLEVDIFIDGSGSMTAARQNSLNALDETSDHFGPDATLTMWRYDTRCDQLDSRDDVRDSQTLWNLEDKELRLNKKESGTRLDLALQSAADALDRATQPTTLIFIGDGENTGAPLAPWIQRLAANPHLRSVVFVGLSPDFRGQRISDFAPLGTRFYPASFQGGSTVLRLCLALGARRSARRADSDAHNENGATRCALSTTSIRTPTR